MISLIICTLVFIVRGNVKYSPIYQIFLSFLIVVLILVALYFQQKFNMLITIVLAILLVIMLVIFIEIILNYFKRKDKLVEFQFFLNNIEIF